MALVGAYVGLSKPLVAVFPVFLLAWLRFGVAALAMVGWARPGRAAPGLSQGDRALLFLQSFFGNFLFSICMLYGVSMTSALVAGVVMAALPAVVAVLSTAFLQERLTPRAALGIACGVAGIALVSFAREAGAPAAPASLVGTLLLCAAVVCEAVYVVIGKRLTARVGARRISAVINLWGLALITPFGLWQALSFDFAAVAAASWALLVAYSLAASVVSVWLWMTGLRRVDAASAGTFTVLLPISAAAVGVTLLGETFSLVQGLAFGLALAGIVLATWPASGRSATPAS